MVVSQTNGFIWGDSPQLYRAYKHGLVLILLPMLVVSYVYQRANPIEGHENYLFIGTVLNTCYMTSNIQTIIRTGTK